MDASSEATQQKRPIAVLISGNGTNLQALIDAAAEPTFPASIACVLSNKAEAYGLQRAQHAGIPTDIIPHGDYPDREAYDQALDACLRRYHVDLVCLAGFMRLLSGWFVKQWQDKLVNIHPSLLPAYKGLDTHRRALEDGVRITGCTVHLVREEMDVGPIIVQAAVPVLPDDTEKTLAARVLKQEHRCYPLAISMLLSNQFQVEKEKVVPIQERLPFFIQPEKEKEPSLVCPSPSGLISDV